MKMKVFHATMSRSVGFCTIMQAKIGMPGSILQGELLLLLILLLSFFWEIMFFNFSELVMKMKIFHTIMSHI